MHDSDQISTISTCIWDSLLAAHSRDVFCSLNSRRSHGSLKFRLGSLRNCAFSTSTHGESLVLVSRRGSRVSADQLQADVSPPERSRHESGHWKGRSGPRVN